MNKRVVIMRKVISVQVLDRFCLELIFDDGVRGTVDLSDLAGKGVFALWDEPESFGKVRIGAAGELAWGDKIDLCPDSLYLKVTNKAPEDFFPALRREPTNA